MSKPKILTREIAEKFLKDNDSVDLEKFTSLEDDAAKVLAEHKGSLRLNGITTLSKAAASYLAKAAPLPGEDNNFINLESLIPSIDVARQLAKYQGDQIEFDLASIDLPFVKAMAPFKGNLWLGNVSQLDDDVAGALAKRSGGAYLDGVQEYKDGPGHLALVSALVEWNKDHWLGLRGLNKISHGALVALAEYDGPELLANPPIKKQILALKRKQAITKIKEGKLKEPEEWQNRRIVLSKPPLKPLKGRNAERAIARDATWWLPKTVCNWFVERLEESHKVNISAGGFGEGKIKHISPEAAELLRLKSTEWLWLMEKEKASEKGRELKVLESVATIEVPREFQSGRIVLTSPKKPLAEAYRWKPDFEGEDYAAVLQFYGYLPEDHVGSITDSNGYPAKTTTPEAADLYRRHRAFWEGKHAESKAQAKAASAKRKKAAKENFEKAAASAGLSHEQLEAKLDRLSELVDQGNLKLAADMIAGFGETWLYEALLAGSSLTAEGDLKPGKVLKRFKNQADLIMAFTMAYMPKGSGVDPSIRTDAPVRMTVTAVNIDVVVEMIAPHLPELKATVENMYSLEKLHEPTAEFLVRHLEDLDLNLKTLEIKEAMILSKLNGSLALRGLVQVDVDVASALAKIAGGLDLGIKDLPTTIAAILATTRGQLELSGLETISPEAAAALESHSGQLFLGNVIYGFDLSVTSARHLARHKGPVSIPALKRINADAALALSELKHDLALERIEEFPDGVAGVKLCTKMVNSSPADFRLNLKRLQPDCAAVLAECRGNLWLSVDEWNDGALLALASQQGRLEIDPKQISDTIGLALGQRSARSSLLFNNYYTSVTLTDGAAEALGNYPGQLSFGGGIEISKEAATHLVKRSAMEVYRSKIKPAIRKIFESAGSWTDTTWTRNP
jgi:hypothetical protein